jgi:hypothetical protein
MKGRLVALGVVAAFGTAAVQIPGSAAAEQPRASAAKKKCHPSYKAAA